MCVCEWVCRQPGQLASYTGEESVLSPQGAPILTVEGEGSILHTLCPPCSRLMQRENEYILSFEQEKSRNHLEAAYIDIYGPGLGIYG